MSLGVRSKNFTHQYDMKEETSLFKQFLLQSYKESTETAIHSRITHKKYRMS